MILVSGTIGDGNWTGTIPKQAGGTKVFYYVYAGDTIDTYTSDTYNYTDATTSSGGGSDDSTNEEDDTSDDNITQLDPTVVSAAIITLSITGGSLLV